MHCDVSITVWISDDFRGHPPRVAEALEATGYWSGWSGAFESDGEQIRYGRGRGRVVSRDLLRSVADLYELLLPGDAMPLVQASARVARHVERGWLRVLTEVGAGRDDLAFGEFLVDAEGVGSREAQCFARPVTRIFSAHTSVHGESGVPFR
jgi:hypothetical protein